MTQLYVENPRKVMQNKKLIEDTLGIKLQKQGDIINIEAKPEDDFLSTQVIEAINLGFKVPDALSIMTPSVTLIYLAP